MSCLQDELRAIIMASMMRRAMNEKERDEDGELHAAKGRNSDRPLSEYTLDLLLADMAGDFETEADTNDIGVRSAVLVALLVKDAAIRHGLRIGGLAGDSVVFKRLEDTPVQSQSTQPEEQKEAMQVEYGSGAEE